MVLPPVDLSRPDVVLWFWRCSSLPRERSPIPPLLPPPLQASEAALLYLGDGGQQSWISAPSHLCSPFLLFHTDNKPLSSVSIWRLCVLNLSSDAASSSTCLCWRRRTKNYCWEMTEKTVFNQNLFHCCEGKLRVS